MISNTPHSRFIFCLALLLGLAWNGSVPSPGSRPLVAQQKGFGAPAKSPSKSGGFALPEGLQGLAPQAGDSSGEIKVTAEIEWNADRTAGRLRVKAQMGPGWHVYSMTQKAGGPMRSSIKLEPSDQFELTGPYEASKQPEVKQLEFYRVPVEELHDEVTWTAPLRLKPGLDESSLEIRGRLLGQVCHEQRGCVPLDTLDTSFVARVARTVDDLPAVAEFAPLPPDEPSTTVRRTPPVEGTTRSAPAVATVASGALVPADAPFTTPATSGYRAGTIHVAMNGQVAPAAAAAGEEVTLTISATPDLGWHIYAYETKDPQLISKPFLVAVSEPAGWLVGPVEASAKPIVKASGLAIEPEQKYHEQPVEWQVAIRIPAGTPAGEYAVRGMIGYQTCSATGCDQPAGAYFSGKIQVGVSKPGKVPLQFAPGKYSTVAKHLATAGSAGSGAPVDSGPVAPAPDKIGGGPTPTGPPAAAGSFDLSRIQIEDTTSESAFYILPLAFLGGFLLNFMPCVLPVIGLKIMSFVQQAGANRGRVFLLNAWYSLGMLSIFWLLALMASAASLGLARESLGWGEQFNYDGFTIPLLCVVFVMGLSFIGVWEIPIPGFVGSGKAGAIASHEGLAGAFFKGVVTTILATPCSGPGLATALTWSATKPPYLVFLVFTCMGIGMALPYLLIGAYPRLIRFLPKPGVWMETFKQLMGFVLMGTVVYMFSLVSQAKILPTIALVFGLWASCWWIGRVPVTAEFGQKARAWGIAAALSGVIGWFGFVHEFKHEHELAWQPFSLAALEEHVAAKRTVLVDFTADWCPTCKVLERTVLNTQSVQQVVEKNEVVTLVADWTEGSEEIGLVLKALGSKQLPVIAIFPATDPYRPKKLTGAYTRGELVSKLQEAGPSASPRLAESR
jgi:thiol:disulfide interchange protein